MAPTPLNQLATVSVPEAKADQCAGIGQAIVTPSRRAILTANLGLTPSTEGQVIRLRIPELNQDRRKELVKVAHKYAETARVAVRHVRRDGLDLLKKMEKDGSISEDDQKPWLTRCRRPPIRLFPRLINRWRPKKKRS